MSLSTTQLCLRLALALLLPLFARTTSLHETGLSFLIIAIIVGVACVSGRTIHLNAGRRFIVAFSGSLLASYIADFAVLGPWTTLIAAYVIAWDALWSLLPGVAVDHWAHVTVIRQGQFMTPLVVLPLGYAASITLNAAQAGYLNTNDSPFRGCCGSLLVLFAILDPMQHLMVAIWRAVSWVSAWVFTDTGIEPTNLIGLHGTPPNSKASGAALAANVMGKRHLATMSPAAKDSSWAESAVEPLKWRQMVVEPLPEIPEVQGRPSTRRRG